jgi:hypothetical protein
MVTLADVKKDLPGWPDAVLEEWLVFLANAKDTGWPPPEPLTGRWKAILAGGRSAGGATSHGSKKPLIAASQTSRRRRMTS